MRERDNVCVVTLLTAQTLETAANLGAKHSLHPPIDYLLSHLLTLSQIPSTPPHHLAHVLGTSPKAQAALMTMAKLAREHGDSVKSLPSPCLFHFLFMICRCFCPRWRPHCFSLPIQTLQAFLFCFRCQLKALGRTSSRECAFFEPKLTTSMCRYARVGLL